MGSGIALTSALAGYDVVLNDINDVFLQRAYRNIGELMQKATDKGKLLSVLAMGAGSMMISHANDAYFWVIARFSGLEMKPMLKVYSVATLLMGLTSFLMVYILSLFI